MKVRDKTTTSPICCSSAVTADGTMATKGTESSSNNVVKCVLNFDQLAYRPGSGVKCMITLTFAEAFEYRNISIRFLGQSNTSFSKRKVAAFKHRFAKYSASQEHFRWYKDVVSSVDDNGSILQPGTYKYEVTYTLPHSIPSTYHGEHGSVVYTAKLSIDKHFKDNPELTKEFIVESPFEDTAHLFVPTLDAPITVDNSIDFCCCCCRPSQLGISTTIPTGAYTTGQNIPLTVECQNIKNIHRFKLDIKLCKIISFHSTQPETEVKKDIKVLSQLVLTNKDHFDTKTWAGKLKIPFVDIPNLQKCAIIDVQFVIRTMASIDGALKNVQLNEISLHVEPGKAVINEEANEKLAPLAKEMEEFDSLLLYDAESPPLGYTETIF
ncbi:arrestin domain-containing protein 17-like [Culicoides brevitarsis]|uniref:arrestin domain-containing protein 17-like n=1 Tax=Culicoides brevitarsis TaxID=469753 RepID=UPI00307B5CB6